MEPIYLVIFYNDDGEYSFNKMSRTQLLEELNEHCNEIDFVDNDIVFDMGFNKNWDILIMPWDPIIPQKRTVVTKWDI